MSCPFKVCWNGMTQMVRWGGGDGGDSDRSVLCYVCVIYCYCYLPAHKKMWTCKTCGLRIPLTEVSQQQQHTRIHGMSCQCDLVFGIVYG